jgi:hypothetical protein
MFAVMAVVVFLFAGCKNKSAPSTFTNSNVDVIDSIAQKPSPPIYSEEDEKKAFAGAEFGMSIEQVRKISPFNTSDWRQRSSVDMSNNDILECNNYSLGDDNYAVRLDFNSNGLLRITFTSKEHKSTDDLTASRIENVLNRVHSKIYNFKKIIEETYDSPTVVYGLRGASGMQDGHIYYAYKWEIGIK